MKHQVICNSDNLKYATRALVFLPVCSVTFCSYLYGVTTTRAIECKDLLLKLSAHALDGNSYDADEVTICVIIPRTGDQLMYMYYYSYHIV